MSASVTIASMVRNEMDRFLPRAVKAWKEVSDRIVVCDDGSTDGSAEFLEDQGCEVIQGDWHMQGNEWRARQALWDAAVPGSEWIVHLDADQVPAADFRPYLKNKRVGFVVYDMWDETHYRDDPAWDAHTRWWWHALDVSDHQDHDWTWNERGWHSGHIPLNANDVTSEVVMVPSDCGILHYAYATPELRKEKFKMYVGLAPHLSHTEQQHALSIRERDARTTKLPMTPRWPLL